MAAVLAEPVGRRDASDDVSSQRLGALAPEQVAVRIRGEETTPSVTSCTASWTRREPVAAWPSTARNAFVTATVILTGSKAEDEPFRRMTRKTGVA